MNITINDVFTTLKKRPPDSHKGSFGLLTNICGSKNFTGAATLAVLGALRSGVGIVCLAATEHVILPASCKVSECTYLPLTSNESGSIAGTTDNIDRILKKLKSSTAALIGCGMTNSVDTQKIVTQVITQSERQLLLDADALNSISHCVDIIKKAKYPPIITPHVAEMSRLTDFSIQDIKYEPETIALDFARKYKCIVVLKDHVTHIAHPDGRIYVNTTGNAGLARGGSGDILSGIIASFAAQGIDPFMSAVCAVYLHGLAADRCAARLSQYGMLPSDILTDLCAIFLENDR
jgi:yjeF C-terminal region, hydroxyethylthiazole kinase-related